MISTFITESTDTVTNFPRLMCSNISEDLVVLFVSTSVGTVVNASMDDNAPYGVGYHSEDWDHNYFKLFDGEINLCNETELYDGSDEDEDECNEDESPCAGCPQSDDCERELTAEEKSELEASLVAILGVKAKIARARAKVYDVNQDNMTIAQLISAMHAIKAGGSAF